MNIEINYKHIKHAYVRVKKNGGLKLSIPRRRRFDTRLKKILIEKGKKMIQKYSLSSSKSQKKQKAISKTHVRIRGKKKRRDEVLKGSKVQDLDTYMKKICYQQAEQYIQKYSKKIGYQYNIIKIKKLTSRRGSCSSKQNINIKHKRKKLNF